MQGMLGHDYRPHAKHPTVHLDAAARTFFGHLEVELRAGVAAGAPTAAVTELEACWARLGAHEMVLVEGRGDVTVWKAGAGSGPLGHDHEIVERLTLIGHAPRPLHARARRVRWWELR